ncbi:MAG: hypothetical protein HZC23_08135 [Rhodocyclales bacterium]|nr:hypothetical protein [Rhodocyclales bacterium]
MRYKIAFLPMLLVLASSAEGQVVYCKDIGGGKTHCSGNGGMTIHRYGNTTVVPNAMPVQPQTAPALPNPLLQNNNLPTLNAPYSPAGTQNTLPVLPAPAYPQAQPASSAAPVIVVPPAGSRICHQFGTTLVCN